MIRISEPEVSGQEPTQLIINKKGARLFLNDLIRAASSNPDCRKQMLHSLRTKRTLHDSKSGYMTETWDELRRLLDT